MSGAGPGAEPAETRHAPRRRSAALNPPTRIPRSLIVPALLGLALLVLPIVGLVARADWPRVPAAITSVEALTALRLSLQTATTATVLCLLVGVPLALLIARSGNRAAGILRMLTTLPLVLPPLVGGMALLYLLGRNGLAGAWLDVLGIRLSFTTAAVVLAQAFVALPFLVISVEGSLRTVGTRYETVAATLGASRWHALWHVTLPLVAPGLLSGTVLCFARALGEFGATALFAGNAQGVTRTMPLAIYTAFNGAGVTQDSAVALALLLVAVAVVMLLFLRSWRAAL